MSRKHKPKLGQNFLSDIAAQHRIVDALGDLSGSTVVEIGPGRGALTHLLASRARRLLAIELDRELAPALREHFQHHANVEIIHADFLSVDLATLLGSPNPDPPAAPVHIVGNLPYGITSDILLHLFRTARAHPALLSSAVLMVQREVADRVAASPGTRDFGLLSATAQMHAIVHSLFTLGPDSFSPPPEVDSTVLRLRFHLRFAELGVDPVAFDRFLHACFAQKRKTLSRNLREAGTTPETIAAVWPQNLNPLIRAEAATLHQLAALHRHLNLAPAEAIEAPPPTTP